jgi:hypothetical protein
VPPCEQLFCSWHSCTLESRKTLSANPTEMDVNISHLFACRTSTPNDKASPQKRLLLSPYVTSSLRPSSSSFQCPAETPSILHSISISPPLHLPNHTPQLLQRTPHLHNRIPQHSRIQTQSSSNRMLCSRTAVKTDHKVMASVMCDCVFPHWFWQVEDSPVCYAADYAAGV